MFGFSLFSPILIHSFVNNVVPSVSGELLNSVGLFGLHCFCTTQKYIYFSAPFLNLGHETLKKV